MWIVKIDHNGTEKLIAWDFVTKRPPEGAQLLPPAEFQDWYKTQYPEAAANLPAALANVQHHGTSHTLASVTPAKLFSQARINFNGKVGPTTEAQIIEMFTSPLEQGKVEATTPPKKKRKKTTPQQGPSGKE